jgi:hypothetical protein
MSTGTIIAFVSVGLILLSLIIYLIGDKNSGSNTFFLTQSFTALGGCLMAMSTALLGVR